MKPYFESMAKAHIIKIGPDVTPPPLSASATVSAHDIIYGHLAELIDIEAEIARKEQEIEKLVRLIAGKQKKLENKNFIERAPAAVVQKERDSLVELEEQLAATTRVLEQLANSS